MFSKEMWERSGVEAEEGKCDREAREDEGRGVIPLINHHFKLSMFPQLFIVLDTSPSCSYFSPSHLLPSLLTRQMEAQCEVSIDSDMNIN